MPLKLGESAHDRFVRFLRRSLTVGILTILISPIAGQERIGIKPEDIESWVDGADLIVVGTFRKGFPYPWWDGWHYQSGLDVIDKFSPAAPAKHWIWGGFYRTGGKAV
jgi:hypothetical protein